MPKELIRHGVKASRGAFFQEPTPAGKAALELLETSDVEIPKRKKAPIPPHQKAYYEAFDFREKWVDQYMDENPNIKAKYEDFIESGEKEEVELETLTPSGRGMEIPSALSWHSQYLSPQESGRKGTHGFQVGRFKSHIFRSRATDTVAQWALEKGHGDVNQFVIVPERYELVEDPSASSALSWHSPHLSSSKSGGKRPVKIPAIMGTLYDSKVEMFYQAMEKGVLGNLSAKKLDSKGNPNPNYISDDLMIAYGGLVRERNPGNLYANHKYHKALMQRSSEALAGLGIDPTTEQWTEFVSSAIPFRDEFIGTFGSENELEYRERVEALMNIAGRHYDIARTAGKITGLLGGGLGLYNMLARKGMTSLVGVGKSKALKNLTATGLAEVGLDIAYNKDGETFILAGLMDAEPNRILSGVEAFAIGTTLNLGIDFISAIKGKSQRKAILMAADELNIERSKLLSVLEEKAGKDLYVNVEEQLKREPIDLNLPGNKKVGDFSESDKAAINEITVKSKADAFERAAQLQDEIETRISQLDEPLGYSKHPIGYTQKTLKDLRAELKAVQKDMGLHNLEDEIKARQLAKEQIAENKGISLEEMEKRIGAAFPEKPVTDLDQWMQRADEVAPGWDDGTSAMAAREALRRGSMHTIGLSFLGGGLGMSLDDDNEWGAFYAGMMLPIAPGISKELPRLRDMGGRWIKDTQKGIPYFIKQRWHGSKEFAGGVMEKGGYVLTPWTSSVRRAGGDNIAMVFRQHRERVMTKQFERSKRGLVFFDHMRRLVNDGILSQAAKEKIYKALLDGQEDKALKGIRQIDKHPKYPDVERASEHRVTKGKLVPQVSATEMYFNEARKVLREMGEEGIEKGALSGLYDGTYWPRNIKPEHYKKFLRDIDKFNQPKIEKAWAAAKSKHGGRDLTETEKVEIANDVIVNYGHAKRSDLGTDHAKQRVYQSMIPKDMYKYYDSLEESYLKYVSSMTEKSELSGLLGRHAGFTKEDLVAAIEKKGGTTAQYNYLGSGGKLENDTTVGEALTRAFENDKLTSAQKSKIEKLIYQRFIKPSGRPANWLENFTRTGSYGLTLINPYTTITNMTDVLLTASLGNREMLGGSVFEELANIITKGKLTYTLDDFGIDSKNIDSIIAELSDQGKASKALRKGLTATGFRAVDLFGKTALINSAYKEMRKAALAGKGSTRYKKLAAEYQTAYSPDEWDSFIKALVDDNSKNSLVKSAVLDRLLNQHPVSMDDVPLGYSKHPAARVYYSLNTFFLKQFDLMRTRVIDEVVDGVKMMKEGKLKRGRKKATDGVVNLIKYAGIFGLGSMGADALKDWMLGREVNISDRAMQSSLRLFGLSRYSLFRMERLTSGGVDEASAFLGTMLAPAAAKIVLDDILPAATEWASGETGRKDTAAFRQLSVLGIPMPRAAQDFLGNIWPTSSRIWKYMPGIGRDVYWTIGAGAARDAERRIQERKKMENLLRKSTKPYDEPTTLRDFKDLFK